MLSTHSASAFITMAEVGQSMQIEADRGLSVALGKQGFDVKGDGGAERAVIEFLAARKSRQVLIRRHGVLL